MGIVLIMSPETGCSWFGLLKLNVICGQRWLDFFLQRPGFLRLHFYQLIQPDPDDTDDKEYAKPNFRSVLVVKDTYNHASDMTLKKHADAI